MQRLSLYTDVRRRSWRRLFVGLPRQVNIIVAVAPFAGCVATVVVLWNRAVNWSDIAILAGMYTVTTLGITVGFHRLLTHRAFQTTRGIRNGLAVLGSFAVENPVIIWVADHRQHHAFPDQDGDPHSPHLHDGSGVIGAFRGLWHAHMGWWIDTRRVSNPTRYAPDLLRDPAMRRISALFVPLVLLGLLIPFGIGILVTGTLWGGLEGLLWGGFVRIFLQHHVTFAINSICHFVGRRPFDTADMSTNVAWLALPSFGESWHNNHHAFPTSVRQGLRSWQIDISWLVIGALERLGLAWDVRKVSPTMMRERAQELATTPR